MSTNLQPETSPGQYNVCLIDPALMPRWFWTPTAYGIEEQGHNAYIPAMRRGMADATVEENLDIIEATMADHDQQYYVALSRGVEFMVRIIDRMARKNTLGKVLGCMVVSSVGPKGYEDIPVSGLRSSDRHNTLHTSGISFDAQGCEVLSKEAAEAAMLHDVEDKTFRDIIFKNMIAERVLSEDEIASVPRINHLGIPLAWYIGEHDNVDNTELSAVVAEHAFGITPQRRDWGHISPLTNTDELVKEILLSAQQAEQQRYGALS